MSDEKTLGLLDKLKAFILIAAIFLGFFVGSVFPEFSNYANSIIFFALFFVLYSVMLSIPVRQIKNSFKNIRFFGLAWFANFVIIPIIAFILALIFLKDNPAIFVGVIVYLVMPCTDWFLTFTSMAKGDVPLGIALTPTNLILQILLLPVYLFLFAGELIPIQFSALIETFLIFILLPFILAVFTRWVLRKIKTEEGATKIIYTIIIPFRVLALAVVIFTMFAGQTQVILNNFRALSIVFIPIIIFFIIVFIIAQFLSRRFNLPYKERALLTCTTAARNSPLSLVLAFGLFPNQPLIQVVAIIIGVLIELPVLILITKLLKTVRLKVYKEIA